MINNDKYLAMPIEIENELNDFFNKDQAVIIFDIGSCDGLDAIKYSRLFSNSKVYAFEPLLDNFHLIKNNIAEYKVDNIFPINVALSDENGEAEFFISSGKPNDVEESDWNYGNKSSSLLAPEKTLEIHSWLKFEKKELVKTVTLNSFCKENNIPLIDYIHMDVQGAEIMVLKGAKEILSKVKMIWMEVENMELYKNQPLKEDVECFMKKHGFTKIKDTVNSVAGDQLWVNLNYFFRKKITHTIWKTYSKLIKKQQAENKIDYKKYEKKSYSQSGEDILIEYIFKAKNIQDFIFLDIGAHHPFYINNTFLFYQKNIRGINIEPNPNLFDLFSKYRQEDINLNCGISESKGTLDYFLFDNPTLNTFSKDEVEHIKLKGHKLIHSIKVPVVTINDVILEHCKGKCPNVLFIDVEGLDYQILSSLNYDLYAPEVICIETISYETDGSGKKNNTIIEFLLSKNYMLYADTNINSIFVKKDFWIG